MTTAIGIDLGGTNIKGVLLNASGEVIRQAVQSTERDRNETSEDGAHWKQSVSDMVRELKSKSPSPVAAVGLAAPGLPDEKNSCIRVMPERLSGLENFGWLDYLGEKVAVLNDAHAALIAEAKFGAGKDIGNIVMLTWGTGVGGGILINGELYQGNYQIAGHLGHITLDVGADYAGITGMPGTLENAIGDATIARRSFGKFKSTHALVEAYRAGNHFATYTWLNTVRTLALGLCSLCNLLSPDLIILGGGVTKAGDALYEPLREFIDVYEWKNKVKTTPVRQAHFSDLAGAVGAAGFALNKIGGNH